MNAVSFKVWGNIPSNRSTSQMLNIIFFGGLETNHKCMNIIIVQKFVYKLPIFCINSIINDFMNHAPKRAKHEHKQPEKLPISDFTNELNLSSQFITKNLGKVVF